MESSTLDSDLVIELVSDRSEILQNYLSIRLTTPKKWDELLEVVNGFDWYIGYPHIGRNADNTFPCHISMSQCLDLKSTVRPWLQEYVPLNY